MLIMTNSSNSSKDNIFRYFVSQKGEIMPAPDTHATLKQCGLDERYWRCFEANGAKEIEKISLILSRQMFEKKKQMKVEQHLRERFYIEQLKFRCKLRQAQGYSKNDEEANRHILRKAEQSENMLYDAIASEFDPNHRNTALAIEMTPQNTSKLAHLGYKREGL